MNIEKGIQTQWPLIDALEALLPVARVFTGRAKGSPTIPYCSVVVAALPTDERSDKTMFRTANIRFQVWTEDYAEGQAIQTALVAGFENAGFALDDGYVDDMRHVDSTALQEDESTDSTWQFLTVFDAACNEDRTN